MHCGCFFVILMLSAPRPHADIPSLPEGTARRHRQGCRRGGLLSEHWTGRTVHRSRDSGRRPSGCERHGMLSGHPSLPAPFSGSGSCRPVEISARSGGRSQRWADAPSRPCNRRQWLHILVPTSFLYLTQEQFRQRKSLFSGGGRGYLPQSPPRAGLLRRAGIPAATD